MKVFGVVGIIGILFILAVAPKGYFGPLSSRVRGLFVKHTKTGNPLVDSVAEHQAASSRAYFQYLNHVCSVAPLGFLIVFFHLSDAASFLLVWGLTAYFFSHKMVRLILLTAPIGSCLGGIAAGRLLAWSMRQWWDGHATPTPTGYGNGTKPHQRQGPKTKRTTRKTKEGDVIDDLDSLITAVDGALSTSEGVLVKKIISIIVVGVGYILGAQFARYSWRLSHDVSLVVASYSTLLLVI
jgi:dolichyl-diphosphooligosaccharide--protein glycosyltransferase